MKVYSEEDSSTIQSAAHCVLFTPFDDGWDPNHHQGSPTVFISTFLFIVVMETQKTGTPRPVPNPTTWDPKTRLPKTRDPKTRDPKTRDPKTRDPKTRDPKTRLPKTRLPKTRDPREPSPGAPPR
ncbi:unnamed protein product [Arctogadus glacialis]